jgi:C4-dicarboxylate-binding protein DctP
LNKSRTLLLKGFIFLIFVILSACGTSSTQSTDDTSNDERDNNSSNEEVVYEWNLGTIHFDSSSLPDYNSYGYGAEKFIELVEEKTNGRVKITPFFASALGGDQEMFQRAMSGDLDIHYGMPMASADTRFGTWNIPYLFQDHDHVKEMLANPDGEFFKLSQEWAKDNNLVLLASGIGSFRGIVSSKQVVTPDDVNGLKLRTIESPVATAFWENISIATPLPFNEVYMALETKAIDGLEFHASGVVGQQYYNIVDHFTDINWFINNAANLFVSSKSWEALPDDLKQSVQEAAWEAMEYQSELELEDYRRAMDELKAKGMQVYELSDEERQVWVDYTRSLDDKLRSIIGEDVFDQVMAIFNK